MPWQSVMTAIVTGATQGIVLFLLSDRARHITMENIVIDGGATLGAR